ncbi:biotin carboxyl carrier protein [Rhizobium sp. PP-F2F-G38]|uniref:Biotin carboxyl carrier protein of acetyl-CoA carboxylase n=1 Tax=Ferranicluibacter rubi TaxID=2715133 RepID=A0AA43ZD91_9HYPH|nr:acetyl-CoA carboxylase biotin carboxyl carrier protein subunit [Ferranicluibacter rubi]PYE32636.1 biotin carboxyl carrier protein [Rhizobium sp. PP-WC-1G-195]PYE96065.1 biotin carboxyl carrier protein [Rhizobium sp. PP-F2F-G38]TCP88330.1 biotin carboxyl carrier protein [Rhizobium sp. PP-CC-2G-626]TCQ23005.1 biotin carboxyl carrier protein [Rhizobium sp. PP-CC-3G-465]NHT75685.1 biotin/lipoyl-binding protein [Ferranicluibacter rubi]
MDLSKIKTLIDFVGQSDITELTVSEKDTTVRIFRTKTTGETAGPVAGPAAAAEEAGSTQVTAPIFGILHAASAPGEKPFVAVGDIVEAGQTLFIIEAMKVFNSIAAPCAGRIVRLAGVDGAEIEAGDLLAEIA